MNQITTIGLDLAKQVFHAVGCNQRGDVVHKKVLRRGQVLPFFANLAPCRVGLEACASAHYWARQLKALGHEVKLIPPQHVRAYVRGNKNDYNDALAIAEAAEPTADALCACQDRGPARRAGVAPAARTALAGAQRAV